MPVKGWPCPISSPKEEKIAKKCFFLLNPAVETTENTEHTEKELSLGNGSILRPVTQQQLSRASIFV